MKVLHPGWCECTRSTPSTLGETAHTVNGDRGGKKGEEG